MYREPILGRSPSAPRLEELEFAVADVETTGLFPEANDRVIEVGVVRMAGNGSILDRYGTLVNPHRDLGPTYIHGITAADVKGAPTFGEIAGDLVSRIAGAVFVGHNVHFDFRFVRAELLRFGEKMPNMPLLCTMQLARRVAPDLPGRKLGVCCAHFGIPLQNPHSAGEDALAAALLLRECISRSRRMGAKSAADIGIETIPPPADQWPKLPVTGKSFQRGAAAKAQSLQASYISRLVAALPLAPATDVDFDPYFDMLDRVLEDRRVTENEAEALFRLGADLGLSRRQVLDAHEQYLQELVHIALADGIVTQSERKDLEEVSRLLSVPVEHLQKILSGNAIGPGTSRALTVQLVGKSVCFTGSFNCRVHGAIPTRSDAENIAREKGMIIQKGVTRDLDFLVAADPDSMSGKAKKAREYGVRIIAEPVFWCLLGVNVE